MGKKLKKCNKCGVHSGTIVIEGLNAFKEKCYEEIELHCNCNPSIDNQLYEALKK